MHIYSKVHVYLLFQLVIGSAVVNDIMDFLKGRILQQHHKRALEVLRLLRGLSVTVVRRYKPAW